MSDVQIEVKPVAVLDRNQKVVGYFAGIFGPAFANSSNRSYLFPARAQHLRSDPRLFSTPEQAMESWELSTPRELLEGEYPLDRQASVIAEINERQLLRHG